MKKSMLLFSILFFAVSCTNSNDDEVSQFSLIGKTYSAYVGTSVFDKSPLYDNYRFLSATKVEYTLRDGSPTGAINRYSIDTFDYSLDYPKLSIINFVSSINSTAIGTFIDENTFRMSSLEFIKQ